MVSLPGRDDPYALSTRPHDWNPARDQLDYAELVEQVERLRGLLHELEWAGNGAPEATADWAACPWCGLLRGEPAGGHHLDDCRLAAGLGR